MTSADPAPVGLFWSGETLLARLPDLVRPFAPDRIDCAAYTLAVGREVYVSPTDQTPDAASVTLRRLGDGEAFTIPAGQFAFLLTEEVVSVPRDALAFISIRAKVKFRGLVNVSGFHVDPGFRDRLIFSVFNAGPVTIHLRQGQPTFLIWYANLDRKSDYVKKGPLQESIGPELISSVSGELQSFTGLSKKIKYGEKSLGDRIHAIEREQTYYRVIGTIALAILGGLLLNWIREGVTLKPAVPPAPAAAMAPGTPAAPATTTAPAVSGPPRPADSSRKPGPPTGR